LKSRNDKGRLKAKKDLNAVQSRKQKVVTIGQGFPGKMEGHEGDIVIRRIPQKGLHLFAKYGQRWYSIPLETASESKTDRDRIIIKPKNPKESNLAYELHKVGEAVKLTLDATSNHLFGKGLTKIISSDGTGVQLKNDSGVLKVRNLADDADAELKASKLTVSAVAAAVNEIGKGASDNKYLTVHDGSATYHTVMVNDSAVVQTSGGGTALKIADNNLYIVDNSDNTKLVDFQVSGVDAGTTRTLTIPNANGTIALTSDSGGAVSLGLNDLSDVSYSSGDLTISSLDKIIADDFVVDSGASVELDSHNGNFVAKKAGTEFSAANSSYAGMILGYTRIQNDGTGTGDALITMDATLSVLQTVAGTDLSVTFKAPPSGNVEIQMIASLYASSKTVELALSDNATFNEVNEIHTYDAGAQSSDETDVNMTTVSFVVTGLTAGSSYTYYIGGAETSSGTSYFRHGRFRTTGTHYPPIIIKAIALPATITTGQ
tara:strand:- start:17 stop:1480 length:1464 start_codon:yes stop_codon:yes gene_type:complete